MWTCAARQCIVSIIHNVNWYILTVEILNLVSCLLLHEGWLVKHFSPIWCFLTTLLTRVWSYQHILSWPVCTCWAGPALFSVQRGVHRFFAAPESVFVGYFGRRANLAMELNLLDSRPRHNWPLTSARLPLPHTAGLASTIFLETLIYMIFMIHDTESKVSYIKYKR